jgi:GTPase
MLADVGLIGFPSVGKSTLIARISGARPEIADYPFTTLIPNLGVVERFPRFPFVVADVPGLIEGAHQGKGLGIQFLKHVQRTSVLVHLLDCTREDPLGDYQAIRNELALFDESLAQRAELVALNKVDVFEEGANATELAPLRAQLEALGLKVFPISAVSGDSLDPLLKAAAKCVKRARKKLELEQEEQSPAPTPDA